MKLFKNGDAESVKREGYIARYVGDVRFRESSDSAGFIHVDIRRNTKTKPHAHEVLEEVFVILSKTKMGIGELVLNLEPGDIVLVEPSELHWFETPYENDVQVIAIKVPNLKDDKITMD